MTPKNSFLKAFYELFSSMRFAVSLLTILAIASMIGTVLKQNEPYANYKIEFGELARRMMESDIKKTTPN